MSALGPSLGGDCQKWSRLLLLPARYIVHKQQAASSKQQAAKAGDSRALTGKEALDVEQ
jgi:hypothetical protein